MCEYKRRARAKQQRFCAGAALACLRSVQSSFRLCVRASDCVRIVKIVSSFVGFVASVICLMSLHTTHHMCHTKTHTRPPAHAHAQERDIDAMLISDFPRGLTDHTLPSQSNTHSSACKNSHAQQTPWKSAHPPEEQKAAAIWAAAVAAAEKEEPRWQRKQAAILVARRMHLLQSF